MDLLRNIITAIWCAIVIGTNVFGLMLLARLLGPDMLQAPGVLLPAVKMGLLAGFGLLALVSTKFLWAILAVATLALLLGVTYDLFVERIWRPSSMMSGLFVIIPTYLLARWNTAARKTDFNPVKEF
jgi:hypothetical protein